MRNYSCLLWFLLFVEGISSDALEVTVGDNVTLKSSSGVTSEDQILWKFEGSIIVKVEEAKGINDFSEDEKFKDRLKLDKQNGSLTITNIEFKHAGNYQLDISGKASIKPQTFSVTVRAPAPPPPPPPPPTPPPSGAPSGICGAGVGLVVWVVTVFFLQEV